MSNSPVTSQAQLDSVKRYRQSEVRFTAGAKRGTPRGNLLESAKESGELAEKFWEFLTENFDQDTGWKE